MTSSVAHNKVTCNLNKSCLVSKVSVVKLDNNCILPFIFKNFLTI